MSYRVVQYEGHWTNYVHSGCFICGAMSPDGRWIASSATHGQVIVRDARTGRIEQRCNGHWNTVGWVSWTSDSRRFASASADGFVRVWSLHEDNTHPLPGEGGGVTACEFGASDATLLAAYSDQTLRLWDVTEQSVRTLFARDLDSLSPIAISRESIQGTWSVLARSSVAGVDETAGVLLLLDESLNTLDQTAVSIGPRATVRCSPSARHLLLTESDGVVIRDAATLNVVSEWSHKDVHALAADWGDAGDRIVAALSNGKIQILDAQLEAIGDPVPRHESAIWDVNWNDQAQEIVTISSDGTIRRSAATAPYESLGEPLGRFTMGVSAVAERPDGLELISSISNGRMCVWDVRSRTPLEETHKHTSWIRAIEWSDDGSEFVTASQDGTICVWEREGLRVQHKLTSPQREAGFWDAVFRDNGSLAAATDKGHVALWQSKLGGFEVPPRILWIGGLQDNDEWVRGLAWRNDMLVACTASGTLNVWSADTCALLSQHNLPAAAFGCDLDPEGRVVAIALGNGDVQFLIVAGPNKGANYHFMAHPGAEVWSVSFSDDGSRLVTSGSDGRVIVWSSRDLTAVGVFELETSCVDAQFGTRSNVYFGSTGAWKVDVSSSKPSPGRRSQILVDSPPGILDSYPVSDLLDRSSFVDELAFFLDRTAQQAKEDAKRTGLIEGFLIHVGGRWGAGKTTIAADLRQRISLIDGKGLNSSDLRHWQTAYLSAWSAEAIGQPWLSLAMAMREAILRGRSRFGRMRYIVREANFRVPKWWAYLIAVLAVAAFCVLVFGRISSFFTTALQSSGAQQRSTSTVQIVSVVASMVTLAIPLVAVFAGIRSRVRRLLRIWSTRGLSESIQEEWEIGNLPKKYVHWMRERLEHDLLLVVDDLDRCSSSYAVNVLAALQVTLRADFGKVGERRNTYRSKHNFVICAVILSERQQLEKAVEDAMFPGRADDEQWKSRGAAFLQKVVLGSVSIPRLSGEHRHTFVEQVIAMGHQTSVSRMEGELRSEGLALINEEVAPVNATSHNRSERERPKRPSKLTERIRGIATLGRDEEMEDVSPPGSAEDRHLLSEQDVLVREFGRVMDPSPRGIKRTLVGYFLSRALIHALPLDFDVSDRDIMRWTILSIRWPKLVEALQSGVSPHKAISECRDPQERSEMESLLEDDGPIVKLICALSE